MKAILLTTVLMAEVAVASPAQLTAPVHYWGGDEVAGQDQSNLPREDWVRYLDPNRLEFWKEGDYVPPLPLIWAMRRPTPQNVNLYLRYLGLRASYMTTFQHALSQVNLDAVEHVTIAFRSDCAACHSLLEGLLSMGLSADKVTLYQVDDRHLAAGTYPWKVVHLSPGQVARLGISTVPVAWVTTQGQGMRRLENAQDLLNMGGKT